mmetsp:Transcript_2363/g.6827  ORF Transcript_2363/g.6827 Transcript_2363/m.6827 type:complete len:552 (-) Transcript_2363:38-1693(-)
MSRLPLSSDRIVRSGAQGPRAASLERAVGPEREISRVVATSEKHEHPDSRKPKSLAAWANLKPCESRRPPSALQSQQTVVALDIDEVLVRYFDGFLKFMARENPEGTRDIDTLFAEAHSPISKWRLQFAMSGGLDNLEPVPGAATALQRLREAGIRLEAVTSRPPAMRECTEAMLLRLFPAGTFSAAHFVSSGEKGRKCNEIRACAIVDDQLPNILDTSSCGVFAVLFDYAGSYPWLKEVGPGDLPTGAVKLESWERTCDVLLQRLGLSRTGPPERPSSEKMSCRRQPCTVAYERSHCWRDGSRKVPDLGSARLASELEPRPVRVTGPSPNGHASGFEFHEVPVRGSRSDCHMSGFEHGGVSVAGLISNDRVSGFEPCRTPLSSSSSNGHGVVRQFLADKPKPWHDPDDTFTSGTRSVQPEFGDAWKAEDVRFAFQKAVCSQGSDNFRPISDRGGTATWNVEDVAYTRERPLRRSYSDCHVSDVWRSTYVNLSSTTVGSSRLPSTSASSRDYSTEFSRSVTSGEFSSQGPTFQRPGQSIQTRDDESSCVIA